MRREIYPSILLAKLLTCTCGPVAVHRAAVNLDLRPLSRR
jgi:hypothetical protein